MKRMKLGNKGMIYYHENDNNILTALPNKNSGQHHMIYFYDIFCQLFTVFTIGQLKDRKREEIGHLH